MDIALKQRLVGASVLIALAVVVLPMLLGGRPEDGGETRRIEVPEQPPELDFETRRYPIGESGRLPPAPSGDEPIKLPSPAQTSQDAAQSGAGASPDIPPQEQAGALDGADERPADTAITETETPLAGTESLPSAEKEEPVTVIKPEPLPSTAPAGRGRYVVQVASFGSVDNARRLTAQLGELGYTVSSDTLSSDVGTLHRVRVGPFETEADADRAVAALTNQLRNVTPRVIDMQPNKSSPVTQPSDPLVRWVVQVGSFSNPVNADGLVAKLKLQGLSAYREAVTRDGSTVYRVRVGPYIEREEAIRADRQINDRLSLDGVVMSAD